MNDDEGGGGSKDILLRSKSVDAMIEWINIISQTARLAYDPAAGKKFFAYLQSG